MAAANGHRQLAWITAGFMLLQLGWLLVMPPFTGIDEFDHAYRADSVAHGHWLPGTQTVPRDFGRGEELIVRPDIVEAAGNACARLEYTGPYNCLPIRHLAGDRVEVASAAARYNPTFYAVVGTVARPFHGAAALYAMRTATILLCAAFFALAAWATSVWATTFWPKVALLAAALPTTAYSASIASPNGLEMTAGLSMWCALIGLVGHRTTRRHALYAAAAISLVTVVNTHTLGVVMAGMTLLASVVLWGRSSLWAALRPRSPGEWIVFVGTGSLVLFEAAWVLLARTNAPAAEAATPYHLSAGRLVLPLILWPLQAVAAYPMRNEAAPLIVYALALAALGCLLLAAFRAVSTDERVRRTLAVVLLLSYAVPYALTIATFKTLEIAWQGRYGMPFTCGVFVLVGLALDRRSPARSTPAWLVAGGTVVWAVAHVVGQLGVLGELQRDPMVGTPAGWHAPTPWLIALLGVAAAGVWARAVRPQRVEADDPLRLDASDQTRDQIGSTP